MSSPKMEGPAERGFIGNKYVLTIAIFLLTITLINSWYLSQTQIAQGADFSLTTVSGENYSLNSSRGKVVLINFMATSCPICRSEMTELREVWDAYGEKVVMVSISVDPFSDTDDALRSYASNFGANWIWARDVVGATADYGVSGTPTTFIIDQEGQVRYRHIGYTDASVLLRDIDGLVNRN